MWIKPLFIQVVTLPCGKFMAWILPKYRISLFGYSFSLNPGPFTIKEYALIIVIGSTSGAGIIDMATNVRVLYGVRWSIGKQFLLGLGPQLLGLSLAGILRPFLVWPASMIGPSVLVRCTLLNTLHSNYGKKENKRISRQRFLYLVCLCSFLWFWIPGYLWTGLSVFTWVCWISPNNVVINSLFGSVSGLGMSMISLDWLAVSILESPLVVPVCLIYIPKYKGNHSPINMIVVGATQHDGWVHRDYLDHLSYFVGYVHFHLILDIVFFTHDHSQERVLLAIYAHICGLAIRQHWFPVQPQSCRH